MKKLLPHLLLALLVVDIALPQFIIKNKKIYENELKQYYSDDEFINILNSDSHFKNDKNFINYKKYVNRLNKKSKYVYGFSLMSIATGIDGIINEDEFKNDDDPPGMKNIVFGMLLSSSYYAYNMNKKKKSLYNVILKYNDIYSKSEIIDLSPPNDFALSRNISFGLFSERVPMSILDFSISMHDNEHSSFYATIHGMILFGAGIGLGYKHYYVSKLESSPFLSICAHSSTLGSGGNNITGVSLSPGYSLSLGEKNYSQQKFDWNTFTTSTKLKKMNTYLNVGVSLTYAYQNNQIGTDVKYDFGLIPFINLESRF
tara:strand:- start:398 stop:1342 length:945 start_codon:yes stop_codon:yes gene_type:complete